MKFSIFSLLLLLFFLPLGLNAQIKSNSTSELVENAQHKNDYFSGGDFVENKGQMTSMRNELIPFVLFKKEGANLDLYVTTKGITFLFKELGEEEGEGEKTIKWERIDLQLKGASIVKANILKEEVSQGDSRYYFGHCPDGIKNVGSYGKITIQNIYPNIDWVLYNTGEKGYKYDFVMHEGANPNDIDIIYRSKSKLELRSDGSLKINTDFGSIIEKAPVSYFNSELIATDFILESIFNKDSQGFDNHIRFSIDSEIQSLIKNKNNKNELIIDPEVVWDTFHGNVGANGPLSVETDSEDNLYIVGYYAGDVGYPTQDAGTYFQGETSSGIDGFILKFNAEGVRIWSTHYGGSGDETLLHSLTFDSDNNIFIVGSTNASDCPLYNSGTYFQDLDAGALILKFDSEGNRLWATNYGGDAIANATDVVCDSEGNVFICGYVGDSGFPLEDAGTYFDEFNAMEDLFILKFDNMGNRLWATCYGEADIERAIGIAINDFDEIFVTGITKSIEFPTFDAGTYIQDYPISSFTQTFILKFDNEGTRIWSTFYGGGARNTAVSIETDHNNNTILLGTTQSEDFPVLDAGTYFSETITGGRDLTIVKFDRFGNRIWATYFGGDGTDATSSSDNLAIDQCNNIYISFNTDSEVIPIETDCYGYSDSTANGEGDIFVAKFNETGTLIWSSYLGGSSQEFRSPLAVNKNASIYISGERWFFDAVPDVTSYPLVDPEDGSYYDSTGHLLDNMAITKFSYNQLIGTFDVLPDTCASSVGSATLTLLDDSDCPKTFTWSSGEIITTTDDTHSIEGKLSGYYSVKVTSDCGTLFSDSIFIPNYNIEPILDLGPDTTLCDDDLDSLHSGHPDADNYWQDGSSESYFIPTITGEYWVEVDSAGCIASDTVFIRLVDCLGLPKQNGNQITLYPNPFDDFTVLNFGMELIENHTIIIHNALGQEVYYNENVSGSSVKIESKNLVAGSYILSLFDADLEEVFTTKLLVQ